MPSSVGYAPLLLRREEFEDELHVIEVDEDLLTGFHVDGGWLMVCETSIRRVVRGIETDRVELGEVVEQARWEQGTLLVTDAAGESVVLRVDGEQVSQLRR